MYRSTLLTAEQTIVHGRGGSAVQAFWIALSYLLTTAALQPFIAASSGLWGTARLCFLSTLLFAIGSIVAASAPNLTAVVAGRAIMGIGAAGCSALSLDLPAQVFSPTSQPRYAIIMKFARAVGLVFGAAIGAALARYRTWASRSETV